MISDEVLYRAASRCSRMLVYTQEQIIRMVIKPALPILIPAIRADLVREMMEQTHSWIIIKDDERGELMDSWLADFLPATEEDKP